MKILCVFVVLFGLCGCSKVPAQSIQGISYPTTAGTLNCMWVNVTNISEVHCIASNGKTYHLEEDKLPTSAVVTINGKPPRWVLEVPTYCPENMMCCLTCGVPAKPAHWECDKGYELEGAEITWPEGIAKISPSRCAPKEKP